MHQIMLIELLLPLYYSWNRPTPKPNLLRKISNTTQLDKSKATNSKPSSQGPLSNLSTITNNKEVESHSQKLAQKGNDDISYIEREIIKLCKEAPHSLILADRSVPLNVNAETVPELGL